MSERVRFEKHGRGASFVEVEQEHRVIMRTFGRLEGGPEHERLEEHETESDALVAFDRQVRRLDNKRFIPGRYHPSLVAAIHANPDDPGPYLVYADWLIERGDARGELITRMAANQSVKHLFERHPVLLAPAWFGQYKAEPVWRLGFLKSLTCHAVTDPGHIPRLLRHPSSTALQELVVNGPGFASLQG